jgi:hypothetical protein
MFWYKKEGNTKSTSTFDKNHSNIQHLNNSTTKLYQKFNIKLNNNYKIYIMDHEKSIFFDFSSMSPLN